MSRRSICGVRSLVLAVWVLAINSVAHATDKFWGSFFGGTFSDAINWQSGSVAGTNDVAHFGLTTNPVVLQRIYTVDFTTNAMNQALKIEDDFVTFDLNARTYSATLSMGTEIGSQAGHSGRLTILDGTLTFATVDSDVPIGSVANASGSLTVTTGGIVSGVGFLTVGHLGTGTLTVNNGGLVQAGSTIIGNSAGVTGTAIVTGAASSLNTTVLSVGNFGSGTLNINAAGTVQTTFSANSVGGVSGSSGTVNVDGANSQWLNSGELDFGLSGFGALNISAGARVQNGKAFIGKNTSGTGSASVDGASSQWVNASDLTIGQGGWGTLSITGGGRVQDTRGFVGLESGSSGQVTVSGANSQWTSSADLLIGNAGSGVLRVENGGSVANTLARVGGIGNSSGAVTVAGAGSTWTNSGTLIVGETGGSGTLRIEDGGSVLSMGGSIGGAFGPSAVGTATITGAGSTWANTGNLAIGELGFGALVIEAGGKVSNAFANMGLNSGSFGTALVTGAGSEWNSSGHLDVGFLGTGTLTIESGGHVTSAGGGTAFNSTSTRGTVVVNGSGSSWANSQDMIVGNSGVGTMRIAAGGSVSNTIAWIGTNAGSDGVATITGAGSTWTNSGPLSVGSRGNGMLSIEAASRVTSADGFIGEFTGSSGTATLTGAGSTWTISGRLSIGGRADTLQNGGAGALNIQPGGIVSVSQDIVLFPNGIVRLQGGKLDTPAVTFQGSGQFQWTSGTLHVGTYNGNLLNQGGKLAPGHSAGTTTINGSYTQQSAGSFEFEFGGTIMGTQYDFINVTGAAIIDGDLELKLTNGFVPLSGQSFFVFDAGSLAGVFDNAANGQRVATVDGGGSFVVHYGSGSTFDPTQIVLSDFLAVALPGDYNNNGVVDAADYVVWRKNQGTTNTLPNDPIGGTIGMTQYNTWRSHFGQTAGSGSGATANAAVPEPTTLVMVILGAIAMCSRRRAMRQKLVAA